MDGRAAEAHSWLECRGVRFERAELSRLVDEKVSSPAKLGPAYGDLGRVSVRIVERAGQINAVLRSDNPRTAQVLAENATSLLESLGERGLTADNRQASGAAAYDSQQRQEQRRQREQQQGRRRIRVRAGGRSFRHTIYRFPN